MAAMDVLVPKVGELIGGSQREDDYEVSLAFPTSHLSIEQCYSVLLTLNLQALVAGLPVLVMSGL